MCIRDRLKAVHDVVKGGIKVKKSIELVAEISEIYVRNYQNMLADPNYCLLYTSLLVGQHVFRVRVYGNMKYRLLGG